MFKTKAVLWPLSNVGTIIVCWFIAKAGHVDVGIALLSAITLSRAYLAGAWQDLYMRLQKALWK